MTTIKRLVSAFAVFSLAIGIATLATPIVAKDIGGNCVPVPGKGRRHHCDVLCTPCQQAVCDGTGWCKYHCEDIPGCVLP